MNTKLAAISGLVGLGIARLACGQTAEDYVAWGRAYLASSDVTAANAAFSTAVYLEPDNETANALYAATRLLTLYSQKAGSDFLTRLNFPLAGRDIYNWTAKPPGDRRGVPFVPSGLDAKEFALMLRTNVLPALLAAETNLSKVISPGFQLDLTAQETKGSEVTLDYADIQMLRAMLCGAEYLIYTSYDWNVNGPLSPVRLLYETDRLTAGRVIQDNPALLTFATTNDLNAARKAFNRGVDRYMTASALIRDRSPSLVRLFNLDDREIENEAKFRQSLLEVSNSFYGAVTLSIDTNLAVCLGVLTTNNHPPRSFLPWIRDNGFALGSLPDPTFGGLVRGLAAEQIDLAIAEILFPIASMDDARYPGGQFEFDILAGKDRGYVVQYSSNAVNWIDGPAFVGLEAVHHFVDTTAPSAPRRFYRVVDRTESMPPPGNDNFANRIALSGIGTLAYGYAANATTEVSEPYSVCQTVWYSWTAPASGTYMVSTLGNGTWAHIYTGSTLAGLTNIAYNDEAFTAAFGTTYQIQVISCSTPAGFSLTIAQAPEVAILSPADGAVFTGSTNVTLTAAAADQNGITNLCLYFYIYTDYETSTFPTNGTFLSFTTNLPTGNYLLYASARNAFGFEIWTPTVSFRIAPTNDNFANRAPLPFNSFKLFETSAGAGKEPGEPPIDGGYPGGSSLWWTWTAPSNGTVTIRASCFGWGYNYEYDPGSGQEHFWIAPYARGYPVCAVYTNASNPSISNLVQVTTATADWSFAQSTFNAVAGTNYQIMVDDRYGLSGWLELEIQGFGPANDNFNNRIPLTGCNFVTHGESYLASAEPGEPNHGGYPARRSVWWSWTAPSNGPVTLSAQILQDYQLSVGQPVIDVFTGSSISNLIRVAGHSSPGYGAPAQATFNAIAGTTYQVAVDEPNDQWGSIRFSVGREPETTLALNDRLHDLRTPPNLCQHYYRVVVPPGTPSLRINTYGGHGDCDLYVKYGSQPTLNSWDYRPFMEGNDEEVNVPNPTPGEWHIMLYPYSGYFDMSLLVR